MMVVTYWTPRMRNAAIAITNTETKNGSPLRNHRSTCRTIWRQREERFPQTERAEDVPVRRAGSLGGRGGGEQQPLERPHPRHQRELHNQQKPRAGPACAKAGEESDPRGAGDERGDRLPRELRAGATALPN